MQKLQTVNAETLLYEPLEKPSFVVDSLIPTGLSLFCGSQKIGKSWLMLKLCLCVSQGIPLWDMPTMEGDVLYLCLVKLPAIRFHILTSFLVGKLVVLPPFSRGNTAFFKNAEDFLKFLQKFFERTKCARPKSPDGRIGIVSSIQMIRQFIYISVVSPGGGRAFFDKSITVGFCRYAFCFMAATSFSRRFQQ